MCTSEHCEARASAWNISKAQRETSKVIDNPKPLECCHRSDSRYSLVSRSSPIGWKILGALKKIFDLPSLMRHAKYYMICLTPINSQHPAYIQSLHHSLPTGKTYQHSSWIVGRFTLAKVVRINVHYGYIDCAQCTIVSPLPIPQISRTKSHNMDLNLQDLITLCAELCSATHKGLIYLLRASYCPVLKVWEGWVASIGWNLRYRNLLGSWLHQDSGPTFVYGCWCLPMSCQSSDTSALQAGVRQKEQIFRNQTQGIIKFKAPSMVLQQVEGQKKEGEPDRRCVGSLWSELNTFFAEFQRATICKASWLDEALQFRFFRARWVQAPYCDHQIWTWAMQHLLICTVI